MCHCGGWTEWTVVCPFFSLYVSVSWEWEIGEKEKGLGLAGSYESLFSVIWFVVIFQIILGAFGLPFGLIMTLVSGGELFTGNTALVTAAYKEGKIELKDLVKNWVSSYMGNFVGSLILAYLAYKSGTLAGGPAAVAIATAKCSLPWDVAFVRGILCNWLVCMAVYMASGCSSLAGKMTAVWFPISAFVALGLDHSVANMFIIPLGMLRGAEVTMSAFFLKNLIPVTLGNIVGGAVAVMMPFGLTFGNWGKKKE